VKVEQLNAVLSPSLSLRLSLAIPLSLSLSLWLLHIQRLTHFLSRSPSLRDGSLCVSGESGDRSGNLLQAVRRLESEVEVLLMWDPPLPAPTIPQHIPAPPIPAHHNPNSYPTKKATTQRYLGILSNSCESFSLPFPISPSLSPFAHSLRLACTSAHAKPHLNKHYKLAGPHHALFSICTVGCRERLKKSNTIYLFWTGALVPSVPLLTLFTGAELTLTQAQKQRCAITQPDVQQLLKGNFGIF